MADSSRISWTDATWNTVTGCTRVSDGCLNCYIERQTPMRVAHRKFSGPAVGDTTGVLLHPERLTAPMRWRDPRRIFTNSMSDLFHEQVPDAFIAEIFTVMAKTPRHTYQVLTKRQGRMRSLLNRPSFRDNLAHLAPWPLPNVHLGVSVENQHWANIRVPALLATPAAVRWLSCEPLLGPVDLRDCNGVDALQQDWVGGPSGGSGAPHPFVDWVVVGGESGPAETRDGPGRRDMDVRWLTYIVDACLAAGVPVWVKQDGGAKAGKQGRIPASYWIHQFPDVTAPSLCP